MEERRFYDALVQGTLEELKQSMPEDINALVKPESVTHPLQEVFLSGRALSNIPLDIVEHLLESGANPNFDGNGLWPPVLLALNCKHPTEAIKLLISFGADINKVGKGGMYAMFIAIRQHSENLDLIKLLINSGAELNPEGSRTDVDKFIAMLKEEIRLPLCEILGL